MPTHAARSAWARAAWFHTPRFGVSPPLAELFSIRGRRADLDRRSGNAPARTGLTLLPDEIEELLEAGAIDMAEPGYDFDTGHGLVDARDALFRLLRLR